MKQLNILISLAAAIGLAASSTYAHEGESHEGQAKETKEVTVSGEIIDMVCYIDHGAVGAKHAECAQTCIKTSQSTLSWCRWQPRQSPSKASLSPVTAST
jgi:hypothetical protein